MESRTSLVAPALRASGHRRAVQGFGGRRRSFHPFAQRSTKPPAARAPRQASAVSMFTPGGHRDASRPRSAAWRKRVEDVTSRGIEPVAVEDRTTPIGRHVLADEADPVEHLGGAGHAHGLAPVTQQGVAARRRRRGHRTRHHHHGAAEIAGAAGRADRAAAPRRLDDHSAAGERCDRPIADQETPPRGGGARRQLAHQESTLSDLREKPRVGTRIAHVDPAGEHRHGQPVGGEHAAMRRGVDPESAAGDDRPAVVGELRAHLGGHVDTVRRRRAGADDRHRPQAAEPEVLVAAHPQRVGLPVTEVGELGRPFGLAGAHESSARLFTGGEKTLRVGVGEPGLPGGEPLLELAAVRAGGRSSRTHGLERALRPSLGDQAA
ncbi:MAG: hypothetical protein JWR24_2558 [Actinoallomurus sp.]|nr:hypothetical protein [Actinoallomurus sp.]